MAFLAKIAAYFGSSFITNILNSIFQFWNKAQDTKVAEFTQGTTVDVEAYKAFLGYDQALTLARIGANNWWGAHLLFMLIGVPVCLHTGLIYADSTLRFGCGHYGCLGIPDVPEAFRGVRPMVLGYLFGAGAIKSFASIAAPLLKK